MLEIIYQDEHLIAINKPHGLLVHRSKIANDATEFALQMLRDENKINAREFAARAGASEVDVRMHIAEAQRNGIIPFKAEIV